LFGTVKVRNSGLPWYRRLRRWMGGSPVTYWLAFGFIALLLAGILVVLMPASWFNSPPSANNAVVGGQAVPATDYPAKCAEQAPTETGNGILVPEWTLIGTTPVPQSATGGPLLRDTPRQCFLHNTEGAVYSVVSFTAEMASTSDNNLRRQITMDRYSHVGRYDALLEQAGKPYTPTPINYEFVGYRVTNAAGDLVQFDLAFRAINGTNAGIVAAASYTVVWERNDWLIVPPTSPKGFPVQSLTDFTGFTPWGAAG
jgi:hypothetical protein